MILGVKEEKSLNPDFEIVTMTVPAHQTTPASLQLRDFQAATMARGKKFNRGLLLFSNVFVT